MSSLNVFLLFLLFYTIFFKKGGILWHLFCIFADNCGCMSCRVQYHGDVQETTVQ